MKRSHLLLLLLAAASSLLGEPQPQPLLGRGTLPLTLDEAVQIAVRQNPDILKAKAEIERARGQIIEVRAQMLPQVVITGNYQQQDRRLIEGSSSSTTGSTAMVANTPTPTPRPTPGPSPSPGVTPTPTPVPSPTVAPTPSSFYQDKSWQVNIQASQLLYAGGQVTAGIKMAKLTRDADCFRLEDSVQTVIANVRTQFYNAMVNRELIGVQEEQVALLTREWNEQKARYQVGTVPYFNVLQAEVALENAHPNLTQAHNSYHISQLQLAKTLGYETRCIAASQEPFLLIGELNTPCPGRGLSQGLWIARERNPLLQAQRLSISIEVEDIVIQRAGYKPTLSANVGYTIRNRRLSRDLSDTVNGWFFNVQGSWAIFDGFQTYGRVKQAKARLEQARVNYEDTIQQVELQVQQAWENLLTAQKTIEGGRATIRKAAEALREARERLGVGSGTQLDVLNATFQLAQARTTELQARGTYNSALAEFDRATAACLPPPDPLLARPKGATR
ncbi:MAG: TolC family protein [Chthoniobacteraceae bacterium]